MKSLNSAGFKRPSPSASAALYDALAFSQHEVLKFGGIQATISIGVRRPVRRSRSCHALASSRRISPARSVGNFLGPIFLTESKMPLSHGRKDSGYAGIDYRLVLGTAKESPKDSVESQAEFLPRR